MMIHRLWTVEADVCNLYKNLLKISSKDPLGCQISGLNKVQVKGD